MSRSIYGLYYHDSAAAGAKRYFYVGRSVDALRRFRQHNYAKKAGHEDKYEFIRELDATGIAWTFDILREIPDGEYPPDNERWFVIKLTREGHRLMNMRYGSEEHRRELAEQVGSPHIRSVADVKHDRLRRGYLASKRVQRRIIATTLKSEGVPDVRSDRLLPRVLHRCLVKHEVTSIEAGVTIGEIYRMARTHRNLEPLRVEAAKALLRFRMR
ncbi:MAG: hypothetical protein EPN36_12090 [Rhodanobacteraceae bacterium]|nr:MAG: hypothetical protein EPN36_12090 [Rhodanobacteraceae bacterium]